PLPQVVVGVDDGELGLQDRLGRLRGQPRLVRGVDPPELRRPPGLTHGPPPIATRDRPNDTPPRPRVPGQRLPPCVPLAPDVRARHTATRGCRSGLSVLGTSMLWRWARSL